MKYVIQIELQISKLQHVLRNVIYTGPLSLQ